MSNNRELFAYTYYHVYNRGFNKQNLFFTAADYERFYFYLEKYSDLYPTIEILAHCVLPNHFHFLLIERHLDPKTGLFEKTGLEGEVAVNISHFMRRLQVSYSMYFNVKYAKKIKAGLKLPVFEGRFKAKEVLDEAYLLALVNYIESNAVKHKLVTSVEEWAYSSWRGTSLLVENLEQKIFDEFEK